jgi:hypothetical protein
MTHLTYNKETSLKILVLLMLIIIPFSLSDYSDNVVPEKITSDLKFYEINTCSISLNEFILHNPNVIYQDHYKIRFNNYSSINCFGQITGIDQIDNVFYISIGTSTIVNLFLQSLFWLIAISFIKKNSDYILSLSRLTSLVFVCLIICVLIYSEQRYYSKQFFLMDLALNKSYLYLFIYFLCISFFSSYVFNTRSKNIIYYLPFAFILMGLFSGMNIYFWTISFAAIAAERIIKNKSLRKYFTGVNFLILFWAYQAVGENFSLKTDKIRGLSLSSYNFLSVYVWSYLMVFTIIGVYFYSRERFNFIDKKLLKQNFLTSGIFIMSLGYLGSSMPYINFMNYYYFGQTKYGTDNQDIFSVNYWGESDAWRGFSPSSESIGEYFGLTLLIYYLYRNESKNKSLFLLPALIISGIGLYASNNKAALITLTLCIFLKLSKEGKLNNIYKLIGTVSLLSFLIYFIRIENLLFSYEFTSKKMIDMGLSYGFDYDRSSAINYLGNLDSEKNFLVQFFLSIFGTVAFYINRSELWGIFFGRFNPNFEELFLGTGPYSLSNLYSDIDISSIRVSTGTPLGFLLPHSSLLLVILFFGLIGGFLVISLITFNLNRLRKSNYDLFLIGLFITINIIKSDSILYFSSLIMYLVFISATVPFNKNSKKLTV